MLNNNTPNEITTAAGGKPSPSTAGEKRSHYSEFLHLNNNNGEKLQAPSSIYNTSSAFFHTHPAAPFPFPAAPFPVAPLPVAPLALPSPSAKERKSIELKKRKKPTCFICNKNGGVYSDLCPGCRIRSNCSFFKSSGERKTCQQCSDPACDGGDNKGSELCRTNRGKQVRMLEELDHTESLPPPPPLTNIILPNSKTCKWSINYERRIVFADFRQVVKKVAQSDLDFLFKMYERPDIVVVSIGLAKNTAIDLDNGPSQERYKHILKQLREAKDFQTKKGVCFDKGKVKQTIKNDGTWVLNTKCKTLAEFLTYHEKCKIGIDNNKLYLIDYPLPAELEKDFNANFLIKDILPGGGKCMLCYAGDIGNAYGPLSFFAVGGGNNGTTFHEDGYGTIDSGHLVLSGYNEVIILRRLTGDARKKAANILGISLYKRPNVCEGKNQFHWPTKKDIEMLQKLGYSPTLLVLGPGEHIHINKLRLHIFRKVCPHEELSETDCFFELRKELTGSIDRDNWDARCVSIAWDWVFSGKSSLGMARELSTSLRAHFNLSYHQRENDGDCQAIGKVMHLTLSLACTLYERYKKSTDREGIDLETIRGILPILAIAKLDLGQAEKYINEQSIHDDAKKGRGDLSSDRYECAACFGELWGYYVEAYAIQWKENVCVCLPCYIGKNHIFGKGREFWRRTEHIKLEYVSTLLDTFEALLNENGDKSWWETAIRNNLEHDYNLTHHYELKPIETARSRKWAGAIREVDSVILDSHS
eukprot:scaffold3880_cov145-Skeletonema_menzelii.AAC.2